MDKTKKTAISYGFLWSRERLLHPVLHYHFHNMQEVINEPIVRGELGIDLGSGLGQDTYIMAADNPSVKIISLDISNGIYQTKSITSGLKNVFLIKGSLLEIPLKDNFFDFVYSFGVLHHTISPKNCLLEIFRILKRNSPVFLYLYEDHAGKPVKCAMIKLVTCVRKITVRMPLKLLYYLSYLLSPFLVILFSFPAKCFKRFKLTYGLYEKIPFNFGSSLFSLRGDIYDRLSAPIERRFSKQEIKALLEESGFSNIHLTKLKATSGWVTWAYKN